MNLDDLMVVWRSQDAAPLHGVDKTLLHLALRQDEAKLQKQRRRERWIIYVFSTGAVAGMALFLAIMIYHDRATGWDFALPIIGGAAALLSVRAMYLNHRAQSRREQVFGESLRDQLNRRITQLDDQATRARRTSVLVTVLMGGVCPTALLLVSWRINQKAVSDDGFMLVTLIFVCVWSVVSSVRELRRQVHRDLLPRKRRLEELLKELDGQ
jgi:hypothetical protein